MIQRLRSGSLFLAAIILFSTTSAFAQNDLQKSRELLQTDLKVKTFTFNDQLLTPSFISFTADAGLKTPDDAVIIKKYFNLGSASNELRLLRTDALKSGLRIEHYMNVYSGIPVEHSSYMVISLAGRIISVNAESYSLNSNFSVVPVLTKDAAREQALQFVNARKYAWEALEEDKAKVADNPAFQQKLERLRLEYYPAGELVIAKDVYGNGQAKLAWKFNVYATEPLGRYDIYIDAINGKLLLRDMIIKHAAEETATINKNNPQLNSPHFFDNYFKPSAQDKPFRVTASELGQAHTRYAGVRDIYTTRVSVPVSGMPDPNNPNVLLSYSGVDPRTPILLAEQVFILKDDTRGNGIETYDMNAVGGAPLSLPGLHAQSLAFVDRNITVGSQNIWKNEVAAGTNEDHVRGTTSNGSVGSDETFNDDIALDAHWGAEIVYDYWKNVHNRFSFDNKNSAIKSYIHYGPAYDNAFWNGSVMTYGDGSGTTALGFRPLTSLDVCGHEIGHGICSYTSDLVYESESGAMNEALSDIWAASIERYVVVNIDPSLSAVYRPFYIGEQIGITPLRQMDNPKAQSNPDTYGGQYWVNPVCTPTLANDQCGVHTNSGVLNKYYYLLTVGSGAGSGPDAAYAATGADADDQLRDNGAIYNSIPYAVTGLGFDKAEDITYLMELTLTPSATFAQARTAAINAARLLYGECSPEEVSVTNAWNAVGVGPAYTTCSLPLISVSALVTDVRETAGGLACDRFNEYNINVNLTAPQPGGVTVNFAVGTTTMSGDEYSLSASSVTYTSAESGLRTVKLRIYDDAMVETDETIDINVTCASPALNQTFTFTVRNDDVDPNIGGTQTLLNENFESMTEGAFGAPTAATWGKIDKISPSDVQWAVRTDGPVPTPIVFTTKRAIIEISAPVAIPGEALYDQAAEAHSILRTPLIDATGLNSVKVQFNYQAGGEPACDPACDYAQLLYSYDGVSFSSFFDLEPLFLTFTEASFEYTLPASFDGKQFYLGIQWYDDANAGTSGSVAIDNFMVTAKGRAIETELGDAVSERVNAETGKPTYFYSTADGELIARVSNSTAHNYGCMSASIEKAGNAGFVLYTDGVNSHRVADKVVRMTPATNNVSGSYNITLYFTEQEIAALEAYTSFTRTNFYIYKTAAANYTGATSANTERVAATYTAIPGFGGSFSASFNTGFSSGFALGAAVSIVLPVNCIDFRASKNDNTVHLQWKVNEDPGNTGFDIERSNDGINFIRIGGVDANPVNTGVYGFDDYSTSAAGDVYYRLKQTDLNGSFRYICTILKLTSDRGKDFVIGKIYPNPVGDEAFVNVFTTKTIKLQMEYINTAGQLIRTQTEQLQPGTTRMQLRLPADVSGTYMVKFRNEKGELLGAQTYVRQ
jgi:Zn-dependent metalloprotease